MRLPGSAAPENGRRLRNQGIWAAPLVVLFGAWLWLAFSSGGYLPRQWLPPSLALGLFGLVVALAIAYPRRPRQLSLTILAFFGAYAVWVALSALWGESTTRVWMESARTFSYLLLFALALVYLTDPAARRAFRYLLMAAAFVLLAVCVWRLWSAHDIANLFFLNRLFYPVSYPNNAAALFLIAFWPLMWLASGPDERALIRGAALGLATGLLSLAIMTQSRGAVWSLAITLVLMFIVSPARLRTLFYLLVPALLLVYGFPRLNRYWLEGPTAVGGGLGARTIVVASIIAGFIGMILALLERWVRVTARMKAIFGTIVLLGALAGIVYGSVALTRDVGGPFEWASQTWRQFTEQTPETPEAGSTSRFTTVSSGGRVAIWRVAWKEFTGAPIVGVGADNFVFQNYRLRTIASIKPQQAHSIELQILGETGVIGGIIAFAGILLALGALLWPRCTAGWRSARETWLRRRKNGDTAGLRGADPRWCNPRWGNDPLAYGWEMALLVGAAYWLTHASVDWLWQMAGVSIPALLFLAAGLAEVDARAGVMWPRLERALRIGKTAEHENTLQVEGAPGEPDPLTTTETSEPDGLLLMPRRTERHAGEVRRRERRLARSIRRADLLRPRGALSHVFRALMIVLSLVVLIAAGLPYLSLQYQNSALALARTDPLRAVGRAGSAHVLQPADPAPSLTQAHIYSSSAVEALTSRGDDRAGAVLDDLALSLAAQEQAVSLEPADWSVHYHAGMAALDLLLAAGYVEGWASELDSSVLAGELPGLEDWSELSGLQQPIPAPGAAAGSLAADAETQEKAARYRNLTQDQLASLALGFFLTAKERNPLEGQIDAAIRAVEQIRSDGW